MIVIGLRKITRHTPQLFSAVQTTRPHLPSITTRLTSYSPEVIARSLIGTGDLAQHITPLQRNGSNLHSQTSFEASKSELSIASNTYSRALLNKLFIKIPGSRDSTIQMNFELKEIVIVNHYIDALKSKKSFSELIAAIPKDWPERKKINFLRKSRANNFASPVLTAHPTEILSEHMRHLINRIVTHMLALDDCHRGSPEALTIEQQLSADVIEVAQSSMMPVNNVTPEYEIDRQNDIYLTMMESWSEFKLRDAHQFKTHHGGDIPSIINMLEDVNKKSFQNVGSWGADRDGKVKMKADKIALLIPSLQTAIMNLFKQRIKPLMAIFPQELEKTNQYLDNCIEAIKHGIYFDSKSAPRAQKRMQTLLDKLIVKTLDPTVCAQLTALRDLVDIIGFKGHLKQYVRQTSKVNGGIFQEFAQILSPHLESKAYPYYKEIEDLLKNNQGHLRDYRELDWSEKKKFHHLLKTNPKYFATLKQHFDELSLTAKEELDVLNLVSKYRDMFSYILSDTEHMVSLQEVLSLFGFSDYCNNRLTIGSMGESPVSLLPLFESPKDLEQGLDTFVALLNNPQYIESIIRLGVLEYVAGPSDLGNEGGLFAHLKLIIFEMHVQRLFRERQKQDPGLAGVKLRVLNGLGDDFARRVSESFAQSYATFQGSAGCKLAEPFKHLSYVEGVIGRSSENTCRAMELEYLEMNHPELFSLLETIIDDSITKHQEHKNQDSRNELFRALVASISSLGPVLNKSARGDTKLGAPTDITKSRAIGIFNYEIMTLIYSRQFMSGSGFCALSPELNPKLSMLFIHSLTLQEIILKIWSAIALSDFSKAWVKINNGAVPSSEQVKQWAEEYDDATLVQKKCHHTLAYYERQVHLVLRKLTLFLPASYQNEINDYFSSHPPLSAPSHTVALNLLDRIDMLKSFTEELRYTLTPCQKRLATCLSQYEANPTPGSQAEENACIAIRIDRRITAGATDTYNKRVSLQKVISFVEEETENDLDESLKNEISTRREANIAGGPNLSALFTPRPDSKSKPELSAAFYPEHR